MWLLAADAAALVVVVLARWEQASRERRGVPVTSPAELLLEGRLSAGGVSERELWTCEDWVVGPQRLRSEMDERNN